MSKTIKDISILVAAVMSICCPGYFSLLRRHTAMSIHCSFANDEMLTPYRFWCIVSATDYLENRCRQKIAEVDTETGMVDVTKVV